MISGNDSMVFDQLFKNGGVFFLIILVYWLVILAFGILSYVLTSLGLYTVAKRRGVSVPFLAWLPIGQEWIISSISDRDEKMRRGKAGKLRFWILGLEIAILLFCPVVIFGICFMMTYTGMTSNAEANALGLILGGLLLAVVMFGLTVALMVLYYVAMFRYYRSCRPENAAMYLVLMIFFGFLTPFFIFACRKYDAAPSMTAQN